MKRKIFFCLIIFTFIFLVGCNKEITIKDLKDMKIEIEDKIAETGDYDNFLSCTVDSDAMKIVVELIDNSSTKQMEFRNNVYDSEYLVFKQGDADEIEEGEGISMDIKEETLSNTSLTVVLSNNTNIDYFFDSKYHLETLNGDNFEEVKYLETPTWNTGIMTIKKSSSQEINLNWKGIYGELPNGNYQVVKNVCVDNSCNEKETIYAEFTIE